MYNVLYNRQVTRIDFPRKGCAAELLPTSFREIGGGTEDGVPPASNLLTKFQRYVKCRKEQDCLPNIGLKIVRWEPRNSIKVWKTTMLQRGKPLRLSSGPLLRKRTISPADWRTAVMLIGQTYGGLTDRYAANPWIMIRGGKGYSLPLLHPGCELADAFDAHRHYLLCSAFPGRPPSVPENQKRCRVGDRVRVESPAYWDFRNSQELVPSGTRSCGLKTTWLVGRGPGRQVVVERSSTHPCPQARRFLCPEVSRRSHVQRASCGVYPARLCPPAMAFERSRSVLGLHLTTTATSSLSPVLHLRAS